MSYTLTQDGKALTETQEGVTMPADYSFATICLGMACYIEKLNSIKTDSD